MMWLLLAAAAVILTPAVGIGTALAIGVAVDRHRDRQWAIHGPQWEAEL